MTMSIPQVVIDTNVLIAAQRSKRGASSKLMSLIGTGLFDMHISVPLVLEYEAILLRQRAELQLTPEDVANLVDAMCALAIPHQIYFLWRPYLRDSNDELVLELAVTARCDAIITFNQQDFIGVHRFGIRVLDPGAFLSEIGERQ